ncbi:hypothetical protein TPHA_0B00350 [Tetrapisispora phaffii CBS 4417]|uniref:Altered inheritance of mitochondria protein 18, mitochondrial n=1 Tax=Tetrapisispora phaffii (strain ATCC 24235 / CBS 4417 / NBRC 1672 / NRRL Y-8282 / UCD 70-5) TaxID=1071381 RepID=G8BQB0_TETPH|nr:hypothetical protein TPHA_0B00350 [Tetrapisispora phaffii CBS 4417]CCE61707.1 hypothetical protein TPHA_0B00350 [Tetrapisispora phaffii CBS 4417]
MFSNIFNNISARTLRSSLRGTTRVLSKRLLSNASTKTVNQTKFQNFKWATVGLATGLTILTATSTYQNANSSELHTSTHLIRNDSDAQKEGELSNSVTVYKDVSPFPLVIDNSVYECIKGTYDMLGYGIRTVYFYVKFKVYCMGIYILEDDKAKVGEVLNSSYMSKAIIGAKETLSQKQNVFDALNDPAKSMLVLENLLDSNIRLLAKITPVRNTSFAHLRDGISNTILNHPNIAGHEEEVQAGVQEFKELIAVNHQVLRDDDLFVQLNSDGSLTFSQYSRKKNKYTYYGSVKNPIVGKFLFSQYLGGPKPLCQQTKDNVTEKLVSLV